MPDHFEIDSYSVLTSLNERNIYIKVTDTTQYINYEGNMDTKELRLQCDLKEAYTLIVNCLEEIEGYSVQLAVQSGGLLKLSFQALIGGFFKMGFETLLREKVLSNDAQLTLNWNRLEQKQNTEIQRLTTRCDSLEALIQKQRKLDNQRMSQIDALIRAVSFADVQLGTNHLHSINTKELTIDSSRIEHWRKIAYFYQLEKITFTNFNHHGDFNHFENKTVKEIIINGSNSLSSIDGIHNFPNLESLTIQSSGPLRNIVSILTNTKNKNHKIKYLKFTGCTSINVVETQTHCQVKGIRLELA